MKAKPITNDAGQVVGHRVWCPACDEPHYFPQVETHPGGPTWTFNGDTERPTFGPSMLVRRGVPPPNHEPSICVERPKPWPEGSGIVGVHIACSVIGADCPPTVEAVAAKLGVAPTWDAIHEWSNKWWRENRKWETACHSHVINGVWEYCNDNPPHHKFNAQKVPVPDYPVN